MKLDKKTYASRVLLIVLCLAVSVTCYLQMNQSYDPLARYPYATDENREIILEHLSSDDINYIIDRQIEPEKFMEFIDIEGFNIHNTVLYYNAKKYQEADNEFIVNFVNRYRMNLSNSTIKDLMTHYTYQDLTTFYETESVINEGLKLVPNPTQPLLLLDKTHSVYKYEPKDLVDYKSFKIQEVVKNPLKELLGDYKATIGKELKIDEMYVSYEANVNLHLSMEEKFGENNLYISSMSGQDEKQLGYTVVVSGAMEWLEMCQEADVFINHEYAQMMEVNEYDTATIDWLEENAYRYGFVIRFPKGKEEMTNHVYQPYVIRYVGKKNAKKIQKNKNCLEEAGFTKIE